MPNTTRTGRKSTAKAKPRRTDRLIVSQRLEHDTYRLRGKLTSPTVCPDCGAVFRTGRWTWKSAPPGAPKHRCPACSRLRDRCPAGSISLSGPSLRELREELLGVARNAESAERSGHPMSRIMAIEDKPERITITTTDDHLPRRIGEVCRRAHGGTLTIDHDAESFVRVTWTG